MMNWIWLGAVVAFGVLEAATAALVSIWFVGGAAVALLASFLGAALWLQIALFLAVSVGILAAVRPLMKRANAKTVPTNLDRVIGCTARVTEDIDNEAGTGAVYVEGKTWTARSSDGTVLPMLRPMIKNNTGYDLKHFFIGAEGTLGVITRVLLRLRPQPRAKVTALVAMPGFDESLAVLQRMQQHFGNSVAAFELMWDSFVQTSIRWQKLQAPFAESHPFLALIDIDGKDETSLCEAVEEALGEAMEAGDVLDAVIAQSQTQAKTLWKLREAPAEMNANMHPPINFDVGLPQSEIGKFAQACQAAFDARWPGNHSIFFGHVGDGNLHVSTDGKTVNGECDAVEAELYRIVGEFHGSVSAEHGIGLHKKPYLALSRTPQELAAMRAIKAALDPLGLMNPGKVF